MLKKRKLLLVVLFVVTILLIFSYFIFVRGFYAESDKVVGEYTNRSSIEKFIQHDAWQIGENKYGQPVFVDHKKALQFLQEEYQDVLDKAYDIYHEEYKLGKFNNSNCGLYMNLIYQMPSENEDLRQRNVLVAQFIDIYENSLKRWIYIPGLGWNRVCPQ